MSKDVVKMLEDEITNDELLVNVDYDFGAESLPIGFDSFERLQLFRVDQPDLVILAARPSIGKTAMLCQIAYNLSKYYPVQLFSLEMSKAQLKSRFMSLESGLGRQDLARLDADSQRNIESKMVGRKLYIDDTNGIGINPLMRSAMDRHKRSRTSAIFVDYLQIVGNSGRSRIEEVASVCKGLKKLALELNIPVVVAAQLNRNMEGRLANAADRATVEPMMSDLADSAELERTADMIVVLSRKYEGKRAMPGEIMAHAIKNRHGEADVVRFKYDGKALKFTDLGGDI